MQNICRSKTAAIFSHDLSRIFSLSCKRKWSHEACANQNFNHRNPPSPFLYTPISKRTQQPSPEDSKNLARKNEKRNKSFCAKTNRLLQILQPIPRQYFAQDSNKTHWFIIPIHIYTQITISSTSLSRKSGSFRKISPVSDSIIKWEDYATQASNKLKTTCSLSH